MLEFSNVSREFKNGRGIFECSFEAKDNEVTGITGPNGSGKTTLFRIMAGIQRKDEGTVKVDGTDLEDYPLDQIGYMPEERSLRKTTTVHEMILLIARLKGLRKDIAEERTEEVIHRLGLDHNRFRIIGELSKGNVRLVSYACAVVHNPRLIILDEPLSGLDEEHRVELIQMIRNGREGHITLVSVHEKEKIPALCDRVFRMENGRITEYK